MSEPSLELEFAKRIITEIYESIAAFVQNQTAGDAQISRAAVLALALAIAKGEIKHVGVVDETRKP